MGAWAKISGLGSQDIKANEAIFLKIVNWRLYIPNVAFERWAKATELLYYAGLPKHGSPESILSGLREDPDWPYRLSLLETSSGSVNEVPETRRTVNLPGIRHVLLYGAISKKIKC